MVTKLNQVWKHYTSCSVLAKIHMVTKPDSLSLMKACRSVLAKIHMVTKHRGDLNA